MKYIVQFEKRAMRDLKGIDKKQAQLVIAWIENNLDGTDNPRKTGKSLKENLKDYWRYCIGQYRIIVETKDENLIVVLISIGHRKDVYIK